MNRGSCEEAIVWLNDVTTKKCKTLSTKIDSAMQAMTIHKKTTKGKATGEEEENEQEEEESNEGSGEEVPASGENEKKNDEEK